MRWKLLRRRLSISAPRVSVRSHLPWPLRWAVLALALGFSAALALWAFETGRDIAGLDRAAQRELETLRREVAQLRGERDKAQAIANSAESVLKMEQVAQERLAQQLRVAEIENQELKNDLGFFERLLPAAGDAGPAIRALQVEDTGEGRLRYQLLVMQPGKAPAEFNGRYDLTLVGLRAGQLTNVPDQLLGTLADDEIPIDDAIAVVIAAVALLCDRARGLFTVDWIACP